MSGEAPNWKQNADNGFLLEYKVLRLRLWKMLVREYLEK